MFIEDKTRIQTQVIKTIKLQDGNYGLILQDTIFYKESGGQPTDQGTINGLDLITVKNYEDQIIHVINQALEGEVNLELNIEVRYKHSLLHSAQHLVSAVFDSFEGYTSSFNMSDDYFTIDLSKMFTVDEVNKAERVINTYIRENLSIHVRCYDENQDLNLKKIPENIDKSNLRLVVIDGLDKNACGGTHLTNTKELKAIKIFKIKPSRSGIRIWVYCGDKAISYQQEAFDNYQEMLRIIGVPHEGVVETLRERLKLASKNKKTLKKLAKQYNLDIK